MYDYLFGEMPIDTSYMKWYELHRVNGKGIVLMLPNIYSDSQIAPYKHHEKLFAEFTHYHEWCYRVNINNISDLNEIISTDKIHDLIYMAEIEQNGRLLDTARTINSNPKIKVVLVAGPSSSGKTTTSRKLSLYLTSMGIILISYINR